MPSRLGRLPLFAEIAETRSFAEGAAKALNEAVRFIALLLLLAIMVAVCGGVVARYVFNSSFTWTEEFGSLGFAWLTFVGMAAGHRDDQHVAVSLFGGSEKSFLQIARATLIDLVVAYTTLWMFYAGVEVTEMLGGGYSPALGWPNALKFIVVPAGALVSLAYIVLADGTRNAMIRAAATVAFAWITLDPMQDGLSHLIGSGSPSLIMTVIFFASLALGVPIAFSMLFCVFVATQATHVLPAAAVVHTAVGGASSFVLLAIPFFLTIGYFMNSGGLATRLIDFSSALVGHFRAGLAQANLVQSALHGGICGSSTADAASTTKILVPEMIRRGYPPAFSCAVTAVGSILPNCFPPSLALLVYAAVAEVSVAQLFVAGIIPGILLCAIMMATVTYIAIRRGYGADNKSFSLPEVGRTGLRVVPIIVLIVFILSMLRFGVATATEVGAIAVLWVFLVGKYLYRAIPWRSAYADFADSAVQSGLIGFLVAVSAPFAWVLIAEGMPQMLVSAVTPYFTAGWQVLLGLNIVLLIAGTFLELLPIIVIIVPLFVPLLISFGVDPVHIGIVIVINGLIGSLTPPVGILVFITSSISKVPAGKIFRECNPFILTSALGLLLITFVPALSLTLWRLIN